MAVNGTPNVRTPLLAGADSGSLANGSSGVVLPSSTVLEPPNQRRSRWWSIRVMYFTMFLSSLTFSLTMSTLWPFLKEVDSSATPRFLGWVVASYSLGQFLASPLFGWWSARRQAREPLLCSLFLQVASNLFYGYIQSIHGDGAVCLVAARAFMGFAAGNAAVVRAYVSGATTVDERTATMAKVSLFQSLGFIVGPIFQTLLVFVGYPGPVEKQWLHFNMYTSPALLSAVFTIVNFVLILLFFRLHTVNDSTVLNTTLHGQDEEEVEEEEEEEEQQQQQQQGESAQREQESQGVDKGPPDYLAVGVSVFLFFTTFFVFTIYETIGTALTMDMYGWSKAVASRNMGIFLGVAGLIAIVVFTIVTWISKKGVDERKILLTGFVLCFVGFFTLLSFGKDLPALAPAPIVVPTTPPHTAGTLPTGPALITDLYTATSATAAAAATSSLPSTNVTTTTTFSLWTTANGSTLVRAATTARDSSTAASSPLTSAVMASVTTGQATTDRGNVTTSPATTMASNGTLTTMTTVAPSGCPWYFAWCEKVPKIQLWQLILGTFFIALGYPVCNAMTYTIYSKVLGNKPQGVWMGIITGSGSLARMLGPIFVAQIYDSFGPRVTFMSTCGFLVLTLAVNVAGFHRLVPYATARLRRAAVAARSRQGRDGGVEEEGGGGE